MLTCEQIVLRIESKPEAAGKSVIMVRVLVSPNAATPYFLPEHNRSGTNLLRDLLQARMELAGVRVSDVFGMLQLNRSYYNFTVSDLGPAEIAVKEELNKHGLLSWAQIISRGPGDPSFRVLHSKTGHFELPSREEAAADLDLLKQFEGSELSPLYNHEPGQ